MKQKSRDIILAILSAAGLYYIISRLYYIVYDLFYEISYEIFTYLIALEFLIFAIIGFIVWKNIKISKDFSNTFIIFFFLEFLYRLIYILVFTFSA